MLYIDFASLSAKLIKIKDFAIYLAKSYFFC